MNRTTFLFFLTVLITPTLCSGMGSNHKPGDLPPHSGWPVGVYEAVNQPNRVHGYWINSSDILFYKGSNTDLQKMTTELVNAKVAAVQVVLHACAGVAKSPWSKDRIDTADWSVTISGDYAVTKTQDKIRIDLWLGGSLTLDKLRLPKSVTIKSGGEIDSYIKRHRERP